MLTKEWVEPGSVARIHDRDDVDIWKGWKRWVFRLAPFLTLANVIVYGIYLGLRIACVVLAQRAQGITFAAAWVFIAIELAVAIPSQMHNFWTMWAMKKRRRAKLRLTGEDVPTVDVFVTCCGEDDDLVLDTVRGACDQDYPRDRFRVIVLDDAKSQGLEAAIGHLSMVYPNVYYMARQKIPGVPHHFKAGNLNYGIEQVRLLPGGAGQFMAALDADMVGFISSLPALRWRVSHGVLVFCRFPSKSGYALFFLTCLSIPRWPLRALHSSSTTLRLPIPSLRAWTYSYM